MPKTQSFNSNSEIHTDSWKNSGLDLQVVHNGYYNEYSIISIDEQTIQLNRIDDRLESGDSLELMICFQILDKTKCFLMYGKAQMANNGTQICSIALKAGTEFRKMVAYLNEDHV
jgi:hypothetical protein